MIRPNIDDFGPEVLSQVSKIGIKITSFLLFWIVRLPMYVHTVVEDGVLPAAAFEMQFPARSRIYLPAPRVTADAILFGILFIPLGNYWI